MSFNKKLQSIKFFCSIWNAGHIKETSLCIFTHRKCVGDYWNAYCTHLPLFSVSKCLFSQGLKWNMIDRAVLLSLPTLLLFPFYFSYLLIFFWWHLNPDYNSKGLPFFLTVSIPSYFSSWTPSHGSRLSLSLWQLCSRGTHLLYIMLFPSPCHFCLVCLAIPACLHLPHLCASRLSDKATKAFSLSKAAGRGSNLFLCPNAVYQESAAWCDSPTLLLVKCVSSPNNSWGKLIFPSSPYLCSYWQSVLKGHLWEASIFVWFNLLSDHPFQHFSSLLLTNWHLIPAQVCGSRMHCWEGQWGKAMPKHRGNHCLTKWLLHALCNSFISSSFWTLLGAYKQTL